MPISAVLQAGLNFASSALGALLAGYIGVRLGLLKLKGERGFDSRLAWYREILGSLHAAAKALDDYRDSDFDAAAHIEFEAAGQAPLRAFDMALSAAHAYATKTSIESLNCAAGKVHEINARGLTGAAPALRQHLSAILDALHEASDALSNDVRAHLGLEVVTVSAWPFDSRYMVASGDMPFQDTSG